MLRSLFPKAHHKFLSIPLLGPIVDGFDDWLAANRYTSGSREFAIRMLPHIDAEFRHRQIKDLASLTAPVLHDCWRALIKVFPEGAGTVRTLGRYLATKGLMINNQPAPASTTSSNSILIREYTNHLREVRGFALSTVSSHQRTVQGFLRHLHEAGTAVEGIRISHIECYIAKVGTRVCRGSLQHEVAALRGFLRFLATDGRAPVGLDHQIDRPRLYRLEQLPRALPWETVRALLRSIDTTSAMGVRDYAMFLLIATYGLRASEVVAITLEDIAWRHGILRVHQRKTSAP